VTDSWAISSEAEQVLQEAASEAYRREHPTVEIAHVILMMTMHGSSIELMEMLGGKPKKLRDELDRYLDDRPRAVTKQLDYEPALTKALQRSHSHRVTSKLAEITIDNLLAAILAEKSSFAVAALARHGVTRLALTSYLSHGTQASSRDLPEARIVTRREPWGLSKLWKRPPLERCQIIMHNDSFTTYEFVVDVLMSVFNYDREDAVALTREIHDVGYGAVGDYTADKAAVLVAEVSRRARRNEFPLAVSLVPFGAAGTGVAR